MGKASSKTKNYEKAIKYYSLVDPEYKDVKRLKKGIEVKLAETHYLQGVKYFLKEEIVKAIHEWDITVALNPDHTKAKSDMEQAKKILKRVEEIK
jgi:tetratricopeptide (TPR) repeat protein